MSDVSSSDQAAKATRIVIAEDEAIIRLDLKELLIEEGYEVVGECGRGDQAVELVRDLTPDIAIFDVKMPGLDGIDAAQAVISESICPVVLLTSFSQKDLIHRARDAGVLAYLVKPYQREDVVPAIEVAIGRFAEMNKITNETEKLKEQLEVRKLVDRARSRLISEFDMTEPDAFNFLQKSSMNKRMSMRAVSEAVISGEMNP